MNPYEKRMQKRAEKQREKFEVNKYKLLCILSALQLEKRTSQFHLAYSDQNIEAVKNLFKFKLIPIPLHEDDSSLKAALERRDEELESLFEASVYGLISTYADPKIYFDKWISQNDINSDDSADLLARIEWVAHSFALSVALLQSDETPVVDREYWVTGLNRNIEDCSKASELLREFNPHPLPTGIKPEGPDGWISFFFPLPPVKFPS